MQISHASQNSAVTAALLRYCTSNLAGRRCNSSPALGTGKEEYSRYSRGGLILYRAASDIYSAIAILSTLPLTIVAHSA